MHTALVLNVNYEPLTVIPVVRAVSMLLSGKATTVEVLNDTPI